MILGFWLQMAGSFFVQPQLMYQSTSSKWHSDCFEGYHVEFNLLLLYTSKFVVLSVHIALLLRLHGTPLIPPCPILGALHYAISLRVLLCLVGNSHAQSQS